MSLPLFLKPLQKLKHGKITLILPDQSHHILGDTTHQDSVIWQLNNYKVFQKSIKSGDIGFGESFMAGDWTCDNLALLLTILIRNRLELEQFIYGSWWGTLLKRLQHLLNRNTKAKAKKNIQAHYDLGNDFYKIWLDKSWTYSSALFTDENNHTTHDLYEAQQNKYQRILNEIELHFQSNSHTPKNILEIGCGWGGFAQLAQTKYQHQIKGLSLSPAQLEIANERLDKNINQSHHHLQDYRDETGVYDAIVSIEMFEAVGKEYWESYFQTIKKSLKTNGVAVVQTILIADELFADYEKGTDFIQQYIFPGGMLPSNQQFHLYANKAGLKVQKQHHFGLDYGTTLKLWHQTFNENLEIIKKQGFDDVFIRMWQFYLAYCEAAFNEKNTDVAQYILVHQD